MAKTKVCATLVASGIPALVPADPSTRPITPAGIVAHDDVQCEVLVAAEHGLRSGVGDREDARRIGEGHGLAIDPVHRSPFTAGSWAGGVTPG